MDTMTLTKNVELTKGVSNVAKQRENTLRNKFGFFAAITWPRATFSSLLFVEATNVKKCIMARAIIFFLENLSFTPSATFSRTRGTSIIQWGLWSARSFLRCFTFEYTNVQPREKMQSSGARSVMCHTGSMLTL